MKVYVIELCEPEDEGGEALLLVDDGDEQGVTRGSVAAIESILEDFDGSVVRWRYLSGSVPGHNKMRSDSAGMDATHAHDLIWRRARRTAAR